MHQTAAKCGARFIATDRPGMGFSDFKPKRTILDWPDDIVELADFLKIDRFAVEGISGGGPYSLACAYKIPQRLTHVGVLSGVGHQWGSGEPWQKLGNLRDAETFWRQLSEQLPQSDKEAILGPQMLRLLSEELYEAFRHGAEGPNYEKELYSKDWGFKLQDISPAVHVHLWHGELDVNVPISMGRAVARAVPNCKATFYAEEGHYSTILNHMEEITTTLARADRERYV